MTLLPAAAGATATAMDRLLPILPVVGGLSHYGAVGHGYEDDSLVCAEARRQRWLLGAMALMTMAVTRAMTMTTAMMLACGLIVEIRSAIHAVLLTVGEVERLLTVLAIVVGRLGMAGVIAVMATAAVVARGLIVEIRRAVHVVLLTVVGLWQLLSILAVVVG